VTRGGGAQTRRQGLERAWPLPVLESSPVSLHYELTLSLRLRPDVPEAFLEELRYHLGLSSLAPQVPTLDWDGPALTHGSDEGKLAGGQVASLILCVPKTYATRRYS
jgi:hypothetical protein